MKKLMCVLIACFVGNVLFSQSKILLELKLINNIDLDRKDESVEIPMHKISKLNGKFFSVINKYDKLEIPYQKLSDGGLLIKTDFKSKEKKHILFVEKPPKNIEPKVYGRQIPERYDDFAWENDKIAFRMYGKALESVPNQNAWGMDAWAKKTSKLIINDWYKKNDYHVDHGEGLDFFHVGKSLGAGDILPLIDGELAYLGNYENFKIINSGPLRITFQLEYPEKIFKNYRISSIKTISLDSGSYMNKVSIKYHFKEIPKLDVFAGIVHFDTNGIKIIDPSGNISAYWGENSKNGIMGIATIFVDKNEKIKDLLQHIGKKISLKNDEIFTFYSGAVWDKAGEIESSNEWKKYLENFTYRIKNPIKIK